MSASALTVVATLAAIPVAYAGIRVVMLFVRPRSNAAPATRAAALFVRGTAPTLGAAGVAFGLVLPAFVRFEPPHDGEGVGLAILLLAAIGGAQTIAAGIRLLRMLWLTRRMTSAWRRQAHTLLSDESKLPAAVINAPFPVVAVCGFLKPMLFIDSRVVEACSPSELAAIAAHERAHVDRADNIRRLLLGACAGVHSLTASAWREAAEEAADDRAANTPDRALDLAGALLKVARLAPGRSLEATASSTIHDGGPLRARVHRLLAARAAAADESEPPVRVAALFALAALAALNWAPLLSSVHALAESAITHLR